MEVNVCEVPVLLHSRKAPKLQNRAHKNANDLGFFFFLNRTGKKYSTIAFYTGLKNGLSVPKKLALYMILYITHRTRVRGCLVHTSYTHTLSHTRRTHTHTHTQTRR